MLTGSHSNSLVRGVYDECLRIFEVNGDYLWHDVFPTVNVTNTNAKDSRIDLGKRKRFETLEFTSIGTGNAGLYRAETLLYCDDLVSGIEVALSKERLDKLWETYTTDLRQRKKGDNCRELHIATRWSVHDVLGRLERQYENDPKAKFIVIPALDDEDNSRFDYMFGVGFTTGFYHEQRDIMDAASWRALYMNEPVEREGLLYHADDLRRFYELPAGEPDAVLAICDTAEGAGTTRFCRCSINMVMTITVWIVCVLTRCRRSRTGCVPTFSCGIRLRCANSRATAPVGGLLIRCRRLLNQKAVILISRRNAQRRTRQQR